MEDENGASWRGRVLVVWHSRTGAAEQMARAAAEGAGAAGVLLRASDVAASEMLDAAAFIFCCPENLATMSGEMKEMFDRCYYPLLGRVEGRPYATLIAAGSDGQGAQAQIDRIAKGWRLKRVADPFILNTSAQTPDEILAPKQVGDEHVAHCRNLGEAMAEGLSLGVF